MAYTTARTWTDGELVNAAIMNPHIRDNFNAMGPHLIVRKTSDQTVTSSTVLVNDTALVLPLAANDVWQFRFDLVYSAVQSSGDLKVAFTWPTAGEIAAGAPFADSTGAFVTNQFQGTTSGTPTRTFYGPATASNRNFVSIPGVFINSSTAGNLTLQFAQATSNGTGTIIRANSTLWAVKLA